MEVEKNHFVFKIPIETAQFLFSSLGAFTTTVLYLLSGVVLDRILGNYALANFIALLIAIITGYIIQKGAFTLHHPPSKKDSQIKDNQYTTKFSRYLISEIFGLIVHQAIFLQLLRLPVRFPIAIQNTLLRIGCSSIVFVILFILRKYWVFV